ncbi:unnamed protein product, partial [Rotaria socialis]
TIGAANAPSSIASPSIGLSNQMTSGQLSSTLQPYINSMNPGTSKTTVLPVNTAVLLKTVTSGVSAESAAPAISGNTVGPVYTSASIPLAMNTIGAANAPSSIASPSIGLSNQMTSGQLSSTLQPYINSMN